MRIHQKSPRQGNSIKYPQHNVFMETIILQRSYTPLTCFSVVLEWHIAHEHELPHDKTNKMACATSEDSDQPGHPTSLTQVDLSLRWAHIPFCWFCHEAAQIIKHFLQFTFTGKQMRMFSDNLRIIFYSSP